MVSVTELADALRAAGEAHHVAFESTDGYDPDWGHWYASHVVEHGSTLPFGEEELALRLFALAEADLGDPWPDRYARALLSSGGDPASA